jgi:hypothetical protein
MAYALCVLAVYRVVPTTILPDTSYVEGTPQCYGGPIPYVATGYLEGWSSYLTFVQNGSEVTYDFAAMQRQKFSYKGGGLSDGVVGTGISTYAGAAYGFRSNYDIIDDYSGIFISHSIGGGGGIPGWEIGPGIGAGITTFWGPAEPYIFGTTAYIGVSFSADPLPILDVGLISIVKYSPSPSAVLVDYANNGYVDISTLTYDILSGADSPWGDLLPFFPEMEWENQDGHPTFFDDPVHFLILHFNTRYVATIEALYWAGIYDGIYVDSKLR